MSYLRIEAGT